MSDFPANPREKPGYHLVFCDEFEGSELDSSKWLASYLPQWSSRKQTKPRYRLNKGCLELLIEADQEPWSKEYNGAIRVSNLQTGCRSGPLGSSSGQHPFRPDLQVREVQPTTRLYTPSSGFIEVRLKAVPLPGYLSALWMIGFEEDPKQSAEICICELKGENISSQKSRIGYGVHPFNDPNVKDAFFEDEFELNAADFHCYAVEWSSEQIDFYIDNQRVRSLYQSITYPMQLMLNLYELPDRLTTASKAMPFPKAMVVDYVRGYEGRK
ncbi:MAG: glycoside hydrolase family 16 protein [Trueperaceae bacterium]|nr:glycoside hydrolase family 16 protein [Trueperaceae bacterium]